MIGSVSELIHGYLDGVLTTEQETELNAWVKASPNNAATFAEIALLHDRLHNVLTAESQLAQAAHETVASVSMTRQRSLQRFGPRMTLLGGVAALLAVVLLAGWWLFPSPLSAATELDRLIATSADQRDRTYRIRNLDPQPEPEDARRPPIDGATLYVRHPDQYVLLRQFPDGRPFVTGSDGERSWSLPPEGAVRVSTDPLRFRGPVPGHQHGIPFVDLRSDLVQLRGAYVVRLLEAQANGWRGLVAEKKSAEYRGPRRIELWYEARTGVIHRMVMDGMPRARGGPNRVAVELLEQKLLGPDFFRHEAHHPPNRRVIEED